jgi:hypothetical protein
MYNRCSEQLTEESADQCSLNLDIILCVCLCDCLRNDFEMIDFIVITGRHTTKWTPHEEDRNISKINLLLIW